MQLEEAQEIETWKNCNNCEKRYFESFFWRYTFKYNMAKHSLSDDNKFRDVTTFMLANISFPKCEQDFINDSSFESIFLRRIEEA